MSLLQQLVKEVEVYDAEGREYQLTNVRAEDNFIASDAKINLNLHEFDFEGRVIEEIDVTLYFKIRINLYDEDVPSNERVEIRDVEHRLETVIVNNISESVYGEHRLPERVFEFLLDSSNSAAVKISDIYAYITFASLD